MLYYINISTGLMVHLEDHTGKRLCCHLSPPDQSKGFQVEDMCGDRNNAGENSTAP